MVLSSTCIKKLDWHACPNASNDHLLALQFTTTRASRTSLSLIKPLNYKNACKLFPLGPIHHCHENRTIEITCMKKQFQLISDINNNFETRRLGSGKTLRLSLQ